MNPECSSGYFRGNNSTEYINRTLNPNLSCREKTLKYYIFDFQPVICPQQQL